MKLAVITGVSGFVGRHIHREFTAQGIKTLGVARSHGECVDLTVHSYDALEDTTLIGRPHEECTLIHLAGESRVGRYQGDERLMHDSNTLSKMIANLPWHRMIFASSGAIYRSTNAASCLDEDSVIADTAYARYKFFGERCFLEQGGTALRLTNLIGEGMNKETIIADILKQVSLEDDVKIVLRDCSAVMDLLLVSDAASAFRKTLITDGAMGKVLNIGSGQGISARALATLILKRLGKRLVRATSQDDEKNLGIVLNTDLAAKVIDWMPSKSIEAAISTFISSAVTR